MYDQRWPKIKLYCIDDLSKVRLVAMMGQNTATLFFHINIAGRLMYFAPKYLVRDLTLPSKYGSAEVIISNKF